ncbi:MAG: hypothetical protein WCC10_10245 [Tumebacillaceae bacterium]
MQKSRFYPFERNRYFYGKLLTVRDFESEQIYYNDKRRLLNRLLHGTGVVAGLQVIKVDDKTISVQAGVALDHFGREIVVPEPVTWKLSNVPGFVNNGDYAKIVYLCLAYDEKGREPVHSIANSVHKDEVSEYNRIFESYQVFVREEARDLSAFEHVNIGYSTAVLYQDAQLRILQQVPRFVSPGELFEAKVRIEKISQTKHVSFAFEAAAEGCEPVSGATVSFAEPIDGQESQYEFTYVLRANQSGLKNGSISVRPGSSRLTIGDKQVAAELTAQHAFELSEGQVAERLLEEYYARSLDQSLEAPSDACLYLAKIHLMQVGPTYTIDRVEQVPFGEYIYNPSMMMKLGISSGGGETGGAGVFRVSSSAERLPAGKEPQLHVDYKREEGQFHFTLGLPEPQREERNVRVGFADVFLIQNGKQAGINPFTKGERAYFSDEIEHGLGRGDVIVMVGVEENDSIMDAGNTVYYGDQDVFRNSEFEPYLPKMSIGTMVHANKGTFRIGVKVHSQTELAKIRVRWWAFKQEAETEASELLHPKFEAAAGSDDEQ